jgi:hypothetical protein
LAFGAANATPLGNAAAGLKTTAENSNLIDQVHHCNKACMRGPVEEWGGAVRWHRHNRACRPIHCAPR